MAKDIDTTLATRVAALETVVDALQRRGGDRSHEFDGEHTPPHASTSDPDELHTLAKARLANAEAERIELDIAVDRRAAANDPDVPLVAHLWSVEEINDANGDLVAIDLRLHGDGRAVQGRLTLHLAASLSGQLGQSVARALAQPKRER